MSVRRQTGPFTIIPEWVFDVGVSTNAIALYGLLGRYADQNGKCHPGRETLAKRLNCSAKTIDRAKQELIAAGALAQKRRGQNKSNEYVLIAVRPGVGTGEHSEVDTEVHQNENQGTRTTPTESLDTVSTQDLVAYFVERAEALSDGKRPPEKVVGQTAREIKKLIDEGIGTEFVVPAIEKLLDKGLSPSSLASLAFEAMTEGKRADAKAKPRVTGWRWVRGTHGGTYVADPKGTDRLPPGYLAAA